MDSTASTTDAPERQLVLLRLAARRYGVDIGVVREVMPFRRATRLPGTSTAVAGLVNVRGAVVTVLDLGARLEGRPSAGPEGWMVLVEHGAKVVGVVVDEVLDVQRIVPERVQGNAAALLPGRGVTGIGRADGEAVVLLDLGDIISQWMA